MGQAHSVLVVLGPPLKALRIPVMWVINEVAVQAIRLTSHIHHTANPVGVVPTFRAQLVVDVD